MSKSKGNVVNPDSVVKVYGADTLRMYEMFMGPFDQAIPWDEKNIVGVRRFLERVWKMGNSISQQTHQTKNFRGPRISSLALGQTIENSLSGSSFAALETLLHKTIKKVTEDIETMSFNTAISSMMIYLNELEKFALGVPEVLNFASKNKIFRQNWEMFLKILSPFAPHITEEIWHNLGNKTLIVSEPWPKFDPKKMKEERVKIAVQVSGKVRAEMEIDVDLSEEEVKKMAKELEAVDKWLSGKEIEKEIYVKNRLVNIVLKP
jgi:leucyl-tRNA synthetase